MRSSRGADNDGRPFVVVKYPHETRARKQLYLISYKTLRTNAIVVCAFCCRYYSVPLHPINVQSSRHSQTVRASATVARNVHDHHRRPYTKQQRRDTARLVIGVAMIRADYLVVCILSVAASPTTTTPPVRPTDILLSLLYTLAAVRRHDIYTHNTTPFSSPRVC